LYSILSAENPERFESPLLKRQPGALDRDSGAMGFE
jgi:hypothetical protein